MRKKREDRWCRTIKEKNNKRGTNIPQRRKG
jgi:hypothetical protein